MPIGIPELIVEDSQPWTTSAGDDFVEITLKKPETCRECGIEIHIIGRYYIYRRMSTIIEDRCENGCLVRRERILSK